MNAFIFGPFTYLYKISFATLILLRFEYGGVLEKFNGVRQNQQITKDPEIGLVIKVHKTDKKTKQEAIVAE
jgi:hypothetical protein